MVIGAWGGKGAGGALVQVPSKEVRAGKWGNDDWGAQWVEGRNDGGEEPWVEEGEKEGSVGTGDTGEVYRDTCLYV